MNTITPGDRVCSRYATFDSTDVGTVAEVTHVGYYSVRVEWDDGDVDWHNPGELKIIGRWRG